MKILKVAVLLSGIMVALPLIVALFAPNAYNVSREVVINKPKNEVFDYIKYLKNQDNFSKWATMADDIVNTYKGTDGTVGFVAAWESKSDEVGVGEQEITKVLPYERIEYELRFIKPFESVSYAYMTTEEAGQNQTKVVWGFDGKMSYPMNIMLIVMDFDKMLGDDFRYGLDKLKDIVEAQQAEEKQENSAETTAEAN